MFVHLCVVTPCISQGRLNAATNTPKPRGSIKFISGSSKSVTLFGGPTSMAGFWDLGSSHLRDLPPSNLESSPSRQLGGHREIIPYGRVLWAPPNAAHPSARTQSHSHPHCKGGWKCSLTGSQVRATSTLLAHYKTPE